MSHSCPVCAFPKLKEPPRSKSGGASYEICPACGFQFGVDDDDRGISPGQWLKDWLKRGAPWSSSGIKCPRDWDGKIQAADLKPASLPKEAGKKAEKKAVKVAKPAASAKKPAPRKPEA